MKSTYFCGLLACAIGLTGCVTTQQQGAGVAKGHSPVVTNLHHKRINTTECNDADDWYLDGYRVGKSFALQKTEMFQQRVNYCRYTANKLPNAFKRNWEKGYAIGNKGAVTAQLKPKKRR